MSEKLSRQQIYDRIRATSRDQFILEEMQRLGFWESPAAPSVPETLIKREATIQQELNSLLAEDRKYANREAMMKDMRKARMKAAKEKREQTRQKNKQRRLNKAEHWKQLQQEQIIFLGKEVSGGLNNTNSDAYKLQQFNLPVFNTMADLAQSMQLDLARLRYLLFQRKVSRTSHYYVFELPKKSGGKRLIAAPKKQLKYLQQWLLNTVLNPLPVGDAVHGFTRHRSIVTNALPHVNKDIVINVDLKDFFPTISYQRVKGLFQKLGYSEQLATIFALISTQAETKEVEMDGVRYYVQNGARRLPQGSPASPAISNLITYRLDKKIKGLANQSGFTYTRYADDLSFSGSKEAEQNISRFLYFLKKIIASEGFTIHPDKTHIMRSGNRQMVTGIVVNEKTGVQRSRLRRFRALLHNILVNGWRDQKWGKAVHLINAIEGYIQYINMVNPLKAQQFKNDLDAIISKHGRPIVNKETTVAPVIEKKEVVQPQPSEPEEDKTKQNPVDWWNIFPS